MGVRLDPFRDDIPPPQLTQLVLFMFNFRNVPYGIFLDDGLTIPVSHIRSSENRDFFPPDSNKSNPKNSFIDKQVLIFHLV